MKKPVALMSLTLSAVLVCSGMTAASADETTSDQPTASHTQSIVRDADADTPAKDRGDDDDTSSGGERGLPPDAGLGSSSSGSSFGSTQTDGYGTDDDRDVTDPTIISDIEKTYMSAYKSVDFIGLLPVAWSAGTMPYTVRVANRFGPMSRSEVIKCWAGVRKNIHYWDNPYNNRRWRDWRAVPCPPHKITTLDFVEAVLLFVTTIIAEPFKLFGLSSGVVGKIRDGASSPSAKAPDHKTKKTGAATTQ